MTDIKKLKKLCNDYHRPMDVAEAGVLQAVLEQATSAKTEKTDYNGSLENHYVKKVYFCAYQVSKSHKGITANLIRKKIELLKQ